MVPYNPRWAEWGNPTRLTYAWGSRFLFLADPRSPHRDSSLEYLQSQYGWEERFLEGTVLRMKKLTTKYYAAEPLRDVFDTDTGTFTPQVHSERLMQLLLRDLRLDDAVRYEPYPLYDWELQRCFGTFYCVFHIAQLDSADERRSRFQVYDPRRTSRVVLQRSAIGNHRLFLETNYDIFLVIVRSDVKEAIEKAGIRGCRFDEVEVR